MFLDSPFDDKLTFSSYWSYNCHLAQNFDFFVDLAMKYMLFALSLTFEIPIVQGPY